jgi:hypothetical protein
MADEDVFRIDDVDFRLVSYDDSLGIAQVQVGPRSDPLRLHVLAVHELHGFTRGHAAHITLSRTSFNATGPDAEVLLRVDGLATSEGGSGMSAGGTAVDRAAAYEEAVTDLLTASLPEVEIRRGFPVENESAPHRYAVPDFELVDRSGRRFLVEVKLRATIDLVRQLERMAQSTPRPAGVIGIVRVLSPGVDSDLRSSVKDVRMQLVVWNPGEVSRSNLVEAREDSGAHDVDAALVIRHAVGLTTRPLWWVNMTNLEEYQLGIVTAPQRNKGGHRVYAWETIRQIKVGDALVSVNYEGLVATGVAVSDGHAVPRRPYFGEGRAAVPHWLADVAWTGLDEPVALDQVPYAARQRPQFDVLGSRTQTYCTPVLPGSALFSWLSATLPTRSRV